MRRAIVTAVVWCVCAGAQQADPAALNAAAIRAYQAKDYAGFLANEKGALELQPNNPRLMYNVACGQSLTGNAAEAIRLLKELAARKLDLGAETDDDFAPIRNAPAWAELQAQLREMRKPLVRSQTAFQLADPGLIATGIAVDPATGAAYIASARERKILRRTKEGAVADFITQAQDGFLGGDWLAIDSRRRLLFASSAATPLMLGYSQADSAKSGIFVFNLKSGKLVRKILLPVDGKPHILNALVVDHQGDAYVSDSATAGIYRLGRGAGQLEALIPANLFTTTQGLALSADEKTLYVADFTDGVWALDLASKTRRPVPSPPDTWLGGLDGLTPTADGFIAVQIGVKPERVLHLRLDKTRRRIISVDVLEMNHPDYSGPIQGTIAEGAFFYVANSQLNLANGETGSFPTNRARPTVVLRLPL